MFSILFNGTELNRWLRVTDVQRNIGQNRKSELLTVGNSNGKTFQYSQASEGTIVVEAIMFGELTPQRRELAAALATDEPARLIFGDEPDKYYLAIVEGQTTLAERLHHGPVELTFTVPDALAHAVTPKTFTRDADGTVTIKNEGTGPSYPLIHCVMKGDNGMVAVANDSGGAIQFGDPEDPDKVAGTRSDKVVSLDYRKQPTGVEFNTGTLEYKNLINTDTPNLIQGSINWTYSDESAAPVFDTDGAEAWSGPSIHGEIKPNNVGTNLGDFQFWNRFGTYSNTKSRFRLAFILQSGDEAVITLNVRSSTTSKDDLLIDCIAGGKLQKTISVDRKKFVNGWQECQINRTGDRLTFVFGKIREYVKGSDGTVKDSAQTSFDITLAGTADIVIDSFTLWAGQWKDSPVPTLWWANTLFRWVNETEWTDIPNLYSAGDELVLDVKQRKAYLNGVETGWYVPGNGWSDFVVREPEMVITPIESSWAEAMDVTVELEEAFI